LPEDELPAVVDRPVGIFARLRVTGNIEVIASVAMNMMTVHQSPVGPVGCANSRRRSFLACQFVHGFGAYSQSLEGNSGDFLMFTILAGKGYRAKSVGILNEDAQEQEKKYLAHGAPRA
jgi:hypothetical protein